VLTVMFARRVLAQVDLDRLAAVLLSVHRADKGVVVTTSSHIARHATTAWHLYIVQVPPRMRGQVFKGMLARGVGVQVLYIPVHRQPYYEALGFRAGDYPVAEDYYGRSFTLPIFPALTDDEQETVVSSLASALAEAGAKDCAQ
jgi:dTDP-4-amino-4,6-dideoxygalactose transaminase